jgi:hypothetical protein
MKNKSDLPLSYPLPCNRGEFNLSSPRRRRWWSLVEFHCPFGTLEITEIYNHFSLTLNETCENYKVKQIFFNYTT